MNNDLLNKVSTIFKNYHKILLIVYLLFNSVVGIIFHNSDEFTTSRIILISVALLGILLMILVLDSNRLKENVIKIILYFFEIVLFSALTLLEKGSLYSVIFGVLTIALMFEFSFINDVTDSFIRNTHFVANCVLYIIEIIVIGALTAFEFIDVIYGVALYLLMACVHFLILGVHGEIIKFYDEKVFSQARLLDDMNDANNQLVDNQEKVSRTNELLGVQKVKLEAAYNKINRINSEMIMLNNVIKYVNESMELNSLIELITKSIVRDISVDVCSIVLYSDKEGKEDNIFIASKYSKDFEDTIANFIINGDFPDELEADGCVVDNHVDASAYKNLNTTLIGSWFMMPLIVDNKEAGKIYVGNSKYNYFVENISFYNSIVAQLIIGIKNIKIYMRMEDMAIRDGLTGVYNRRQLNKMVSECIERMNSNPNAKLSSVLLDIDKFKNINDSYGHMFGDVVIKGIADTITQIAQYRDDIIAARYGGEEFVIIFDNVNFEEVCKIVEQLHKNIMKKEFENKGEIIHVNVSIGIASYPETCDNPQALLNRSDWAMYYSKQNGRGRITIDNPEVDKLRK